MADLYQILEVPADAEAKDIERAYRKKSMKHHPDRENGDSTEFKEVAEAYQVLIDPDKRKRYDETGNTSQEARPIESIFLSFFNGALGKMLSSGKDPTTTDLLLMVRNEIKDIRASIEAGIKKTNKQIAGLKTVLSRVRCKEGINLLDNSLKAQVKSAEQHVAEGNSHLAELQQCEEMLGNYTYEYAPPQETNHYNFASAKQDYEQLTRLFEQMNGGAWEPKQ